MTLVAANLLNFPMSSISHNKQSKIRLIWHRRDLRLHDNELYSNLDENTASVSLFVFDNKYFEPQPSMIKREKDCYQTVWCGPHAAHALIEAVQSLRNAIRSIGGELLVRVGDPCVIVPQIAEEIAANEIIFNEEPGFYENLIVRKLRKHYTVQRDLGGYFAKLISKCGYTLYHPHDLPMDSFEWDRLAHPKNKRSKSKKKNKNKSEKTRTSLEGDYFDLVDVSCDRFEGMCRIMGDFRRAARSAATVRKLVDAPASLIKPHVFSTSFLREQEGPIPSLQDLMRPLMDAASKNEIFGLDQKSVELIIKSAVVKTEETKYNSKETFGEKAAQERLNFFIGEGHAINADRSKADVSENNSSRLSVHLSLGTISPRLIYWNSLEAKDECNWLMSHLEMRDFFLYTTFAAGSNIFCRKGIPVNKRHENITWISPQEDLERWRRWATGKTQLPMVDAAMLELMTTGYCSNRVRQNIASVLTKDLQIDWRAGAEWFQFLLEDHCVGANFGNWLYFSGVGPDPKNRHFRTISQQKRYDADGEYVKKWIPILRGKKLECILRPWDFGIKGFEMPIVDPESQYTWQDMKRLKEGGKLLT
mmetsp:Transcript_19764/g.44874  ORF Transcript_19764/g.44874 Transcript_19764/m.44874 type:complete len:590 (-) Transcript_19764:131-1900(-)|eukprot:CAMPEP_0113302618 /NCGR_PEP_ID=MMETSP0010_2-20120614/3369_1 /TAXON_ID=216773 ORGANISM="Corethron hystrix, Strain 308" /NCGR_SAMPLE_ID=MMETSP0010_2 /ASSEMBLY_ACC=CAM_ASM_000155 /LENGTH=589 /DNA_ID=CAMNT_0000156465 /DNA_START=31 /DNA_END=1800 /DNA_ORIENTATION=+ /assembly_acc=CAM_ASM_000155